MRKILAITVIVVLLALLVAPAAFAGNGGNGGNGQGVGRLSAPGQAKKADDPSADTSATVPGSSRSTGHGRSGDATGSAERSRSESGTVDRAQERSGIGTAVARIQANIAKAEEKVLSGEKKQVPPGLLKVLDKFMGWLSGEAPEVPRAPY